METRVDINMVSAEEIRNRCDVGPSTAETIVKQRPFNSLDEVREVPGIGPEIVDKLEQHGCYPGSSH